MLEPPSGVPGFSPKKFTTKDELFDFPIKIEPVFHRFQPPLIGLLVDAITEKFEKENLSFPRKSVKTVKTTYISSLVEGTVIDFIPATSLLNTHLIFPLQKHTKTI